MGLLRGLSGRLLILTVLIVMLVEVAIFVPSVSRFRVSHLEERLARAHIAGLVVTASPDGMVTPELERTLLEQAGVLNIVMRRAGTRMMLLTSGPLEQVEASFDLRTATVPELIRDALSRLLSAPGPAVIRVIGTPPGVRPDPLALHADPLEITLDAAPLRAAMIDYGMRILRLSLIISLFTAVVVFLVIRRVVVMPMQRVIANVQAFQQNPEDPGRVFRPSGRIGEVAEAERALAAMQTDVLQALRARARLASLGEALAKINHDLRNMLSAQQLMVDRLEASTDPTVARVMPKMIATLNRAISLCQRTLDYGGAEEVPPELRLVALRALVLEVAETLGLSSDQGIVRCRVDIAPALTVPADPEQLYRVLANLMRNALEAMSGTGRPGEIAIAAEAQTDWSVITVADTGPGLPARAREHLFKPFRSGARKGGSGLGLSIAHDLVRAHGGTLRLVGSTTQGTTFEIRLPSGNGG